MRNSINRTVLNAALASAILLATIAAGSPVAMAARNDFTLHRFRECPSGATNCVDGIERDEAGRIRQVHHDSETFRSLVAELGLVMAPPRLSPAATSGQAGFEFSAGLRATPIDNNADHWQKAQSGDSGSPPSSVLNAIHLSLRKGLPLSLELGGSLVHLLQSSTFALGAEIRWALVEGFRYSPDLTIRGAVNRLVGNPDLDMLISTGDITISKGFALARTMRLTPYAGFNLTLINASSHVLDATPGIDPFPSPNCTINEEGQMVDAITGRRTQECIRAQHSQETRDWEANFVLPSQSLLVQQIFMGVQARFTALILTLEATISPEVNQYSSSLGFSF